MPIAGLLTGYAARSRTPHSDAAAMRQEKPSRMQPYELESFGVVRTDRMRYAPLDEVRVTFGCQNAPSEAFVFKTYDGAGRSYHRKEVTASDGVAEFSMLAGGTPGLHAIRVFKQGANENSFHCLRMGSFVLEAQTIAWADGTDIDDFFRWLGDSLASCLDWVLYDGRWVAGDKAADNSPMNLAYPRFRLDSTVYLEQAEVLKGHIDLCYRYQKSDGSLHDHIYGDGSPGREGKRAIRSMMADLETGLIINVYQVWMATGDTEWMKSLMEAMLRSWRYATTSPDLWSEEYGLIRKPHTADEWDFQMGDGSCFRNENSKYVVACCDGVRLPRAADALAAMLDAFDRREEARSLRKFANDARKRANDLLWDGAKYRHHQHIDPVDHGGCDEDAQLAMSNTWACNDGLADHEQAVSIIEEYRRRLEQTGDRYPWWSLQPGYPEGHFPGKPPGFYANGGLFPWVGGQLCRACFQHGFESRGWCLFREFWEQVKSDHGACVTWYTLDGRAAANTPWTTNYDAWGIASWGQATIEGLVGIVPTAPAFERCRCVPQWTAGDVKQAKACVAMPASRSYFAYTYAADGGGVVVRFTGSGNEVEVCVPVRDVPQLTKARLNGSHVDVREDTWNGMSFICLTANPAGVNTLRVE